MIARRALLLGLLAGTATAALAAAEPLPSFSVEVRDGVFSPKRLEIPAGRRVKIELINHGPGPLEFENDEMHIEKVLAAGARSFLVLPALAPGRYEFVDEFNPVSGVLEVLVR
ncbi:cupredoxin domain-containing protein [Paucibacter soli]|uniref:cupredoxin domain-containing protein n=1 Tax=Paucibacter soli TaxID=3133433 RepID=UPI00309C9557